jgi:hypothetical protein
MFSSARFSRNRFVGLVGGALFVLLGAIGFLVTTEVPFAGAEGGVLFTLLELNGLQNVVHLAIGVALIAGSFGSLRFTAAFNSVIGAVCFALGFYGLFAIDLPADQLSLNTWGNALHFGAAAVLLAVGLGADRESRAH